VEARLGAEYWYGSVRNCASQFVIRERKLHWMTAFMVLNDRTLAVCRSLVPSEEAATKRGNVNHKKRPHEYRARM
jgi:hypothetical protein